MITDSAFSELLGAVCLVGIGFGFAACLVTLAIVAVEGARSAIRRLR